MTLNWNGANTNAGGTLEIDGALFVSPPHSLLVDFPAESVPAPGKNMNLSKELPGVARPVVELDLMLWVDACGNCADWSCSIIAFEGGNDVQSAVVYLSPLGVTADMTAYPGGKSPALEVGMAADRSWHHLRLEPSFDAKGGGLRTVVDGTTAIWAAASTHSAPRSPPSSRSAWAFGATDPPPGCTLDSTT